MVHGLETFLVDPAGLLAEVSWSAAWRREKRIRLPCRLQPAVPLQLLHLDRHVWSLTNDIFARSLRSSYQEVVFIVLAWFARHVLAAFQC